MEIDKALNNIESLVSTFHKVITKIDMIDSFNTIRAALVEVQKPSDNTGSPKLIGELLNILDASSFVSERSRDRAYEIINQLRAGA